MIMEKMVEFIAERKISGMYVTISQHSVDGHNDLARRGMVLVGARLGAAYVQMEVPISVYNSESFEPYVTLYFIPEIKDIIFRNEILKQS